MLGAQSRHSQTLFELSIRNEMLGYHAILDHDWKHWRHTLCSHIQSSFYWKVIFVRRFRLSEAAGMFRLHEVWACRDKLANTSLVWSYNASTYTAGLPRGVRP